MFAGLLAFALVADSPADVWSGFRNGGAGVSRAARVPVAWSAKDVAWKARLPGYGQSSPVVWKGRVFVTAVEGDNHDACLVLAFDAASGKNLWTHRFPAGQTMKSGMFTSRAAPTPIVDDAGLFVFFETGDLRRLAHDGQATWQRALAKDHGAIQSNHGLAASPAGTPNALFLLVDHQGPSYLLAVSKRDGKDLWKTDRPTKTTWTSPVVAPTADGPIILVSGAGRVQGYDAASGKLLWTEEGLSGNNFGSPALAGDVMVIGAAESKTATDLEAVARSNCCMRLLARPGEAGSRFVWRATKVLSSMATPLAYRECAYFVNKTGVVTCVDLKSGTVHYRERLDEPCWASPAAAGEHIYFFGKDGVTTVLRAGPRFDKVASNTLAASAAGAESRAGEMYAHDDTVYGAALVDGAILIRSGTTLYCVRNRH